MKDGSNGIVVRRRRTWYRRRLRRQRALAAAILFVVLAAVCWQSAARFFKLPSLHASDVLPDSFTKRNYGQTNLAIRSYSRKQTTPVRIAG